MSQKHDKHQFELISDCYSKHHQQIRDDLALLREKTVDINAAVSALLTREREVLQQGEEVKKEIQTHAQQLIDQVQRSERELLQQLFVLVQQKIRLLKKQRIQAEKVHAQLKAYMELIEKSLKDWDQQQVMEEKERILNQMKSISQDVEPTVFQPIEEADIKVVKKEIVDEEIAQISSRRYGKTVLDLKPLICSPNTTSTTTLTLQSHDESLLSLPPSLISCRLYSSGDQKPSRCDINQKQQGKYSISFVPHTIGKAQLIVQVGGVDVSGSPFTVPVMSLSAMRGKPVKTITGLHHPYGIAISNEGDIVVTEKGSDCITILKKEGKKVRSFGTREINQEEFEAPRGVAISDDEHILVSSNHDLCKFTFDGVFVKSVGRLHGDPHLAFNCPFGVTVHPTTGEIFVADSGNNCIQVFHSDLDISHTISLQGDKQFNVPTDTALDSDGYLYIAEQHNHCITKLTTTGHYITRFGSKGTAPGELNYPTSLAISNNLVYVSERGTHRVSIFDIEGTFLHCFGSRGVLNEPRGIVMDRSGKLYVSDFENNRIVLF